MYDPTGYKIELKVEQTLYYEVLKANNKILFDVAFDV